MLLATIVYHKPATELYNVDVEVPGRTNVQRAFVFEDGGQGRRIIRRSVVKDEQRWGAQ